MLDTFNECLELARSQGRSMGSDTEIAELRLAFVAAVGLSDPQSFMMALSAISMRQECSQIVRQAIQDNSHLAIMLEDIDIEMQRIGPLSIVELVYNLTGEQ